MRIWCLIVKHSEFKELSGLVRIVFYLSLQASINATNPSLYIEH